MCRLYYINIVIDFSINHKTQCYLSDIINVVLYCPQEADGKHAVKSSALCVLKRQVQVFGGLMLYSPVKYL